MTQIEELVERLKVIADDPMWDAHCEISKATLRSTIEAISTLLRERDEARAKALTGSVTLDHVKDLSKQGWAAIFDARQFLDLGTPADIEEAKQNIDLALPSFADAIMESENRAQAATARAESAEAQVETLKQVVADLLPYADSFTHVGVVRWDEGAQAALVASARAALEPKP